MIYVILKGRIGNQLFMYSIAEQIKKNKKGDEIIIDDKSVLDENWTDDLEYYDLDKNNVTFVHNHKMLKKINFLIPMIGFFLYKVMVYKKDYLKKYEIEKKYQKFFNFLGLVVCENGYLPYELKRKNIIIHGYFQSEKYFKNISADIKNEFSLENNQQLSLYPNIDKIRKRNTVCISIKVEHNVGNEIDDVCTKKYWEDAIKYMIDNVDDPLFFICSDNVEYVKNNLIDCEKYDVVCQAKNYPSPVALAAMAQSKHFIIGNTTFGWWAQYLSKNSNKIVVAPKKWMNCEMPIDIYQDNWVLM